MKFITKNLAEIKEIIEYCVNAEIPDYHRNIEEIKCNKNIAVLGNFDGIHKGHQVILRKAVKRAREKGLKTIVYTFSEYPKNQQTKITTCSEKAYLLNKNEIDYLYLEQFEKVRNYSPEEFVEKVIVNELNADEVYCGFNFTFGKGKSGNIGILEKLLKERNIKLNVQDAVLDEEGEVISSTRIILIRSRNFLDIISLFLGRLFMGNNLEELLAFLRQI